MAETRKYQPSTSAVGDAIRAALGESVRPVTPGSAPGPKPEEPATPPTLTTRTFTFGSAKEDE